MTIDKILYRTQKDKMLLDFTSEAMLHAMGDYFTSAGLEDPSHFGYGASKALELVKKEKDDRAKAFAAKKTAKMEQPYVQLGLSGKDLACQIKDNKSKQESSVIMMKGFVDEVQKITNASNAVVNVSPNKNETIIKKAAEHQAARLGTDVTTEDDTEFGAITGNIVLCAHGTPKILPGKVIGQQLGKKSAEQIVEILTGNADKAKRIPKEYSGVITLSGCYTAAGGPEADAADPVFAKKVRDLLIGKGYKYARVEGMPGPSWTSYDKSEKDNYGTSVDAGKKAVRPAMETQRGIEAYQARIDENADKLDAAFAKWTGKPEDFVNLPKVKEIVAQMDKDRLALDTVVANMAKKDDPALANEVNPSKSIGALKGYFGPAKYKTKPWYQKLFS